jgi:very-short-patch-repair endonuclease
MTTERIMVFGPKGSCEYVIHVTSRYKKKNLSIGENRIYNYLKYNNIDFEGQKRFDDCRGKRNTLPFDFYIPHKNMCIEFDGAQHFRAIEKWGGMDNLKTVKRNDGIKTRYCKRNGIKLVRIPYWDMNKIDEILKRIL